MLCSVVTKNGDRREDEGMRMWEWCLRQGSLFEGNSEK